MNLRQVVSEYVSKHLSGLAIVSADVAVKMAPVIATHNGSFHCDEALACGLLRHTEPFATAAIVRTRDPKVIEACAAVVDVGAAYDPETRRFDHHQASFHDTMTTAKKTYRTRLSSAGLVYRHFGRQVMADFVAALLASPQRAAVLRMTGWPEDREGLTIEESDILFDAVYANFVEEMDGVDNGVEPFTLEDPAVGKLIKAYTQSTSLSARVGQLQPWWNAPENGDAAIESAMFTEAVELTTNAFFSAVAYYSLSWLPARTLVERAFAQAAEVHASGQIIALKDKFCPWKDHLLQLEEEHGCVGKVLYVLYSDGRAWRVQAVPQTSSGFATRKPLPYRGLRDEELSAASGIEGGVFVHVGGFIGGMKTYEGALQLAIKALQAE